VNFLFECYEEHFTFVLTIIIDVWCREEGISINETLILLMLPVMIFYFTFCVEICQILPCQFIKPQSSAGCSVLPHSNPNVVVTVASS